MKKTKNNKGFSLADTLVVLAIITILVVLAWPTIKGLVDEHKKATEMRTLPVEPEKPQ